jgi:cyanophycin synthetase
MRRTRRKIFSGPNHFANQAVVVWELEFTNEEVSRLNGQVASALQAAYPAWLPPSPNPMASTPVHVIQLVAQWTRGFLNANGALIQNAGAQAAEGDRIVIWTGYVDAGIAEQALLIGLATIQDLAAGRPARSDETIEALRQLSVRCQGSHPDMMARILILAANAQNIPVARAIKEERFWQFGWGHASRVFFQSQSDLDSAQASDVARYKMISAAFIRRMGFPASVHFPAATADQAIAHAATLGGAVVIKPADRGTGKGVSVGIQAPEDIRRAFEEARRFTSQPVLVERMVEGDDHRLLVVGGTLIAAARRRPAAVLGDGESTIQNLIAHLNASRRRNPVSARYLRQVKIDDTLVRQLVRQEVDLETVLPEGRRIWLRSNANISTGGEPDDVLAAVHPDVRAMAECIARNVAAHAIGIDYMTSDVGRSWRDLPGAIIEINLNPGLDVHCASGFDEVELGTLILGPGLGRIPIAVVVTDAAKGVTLAETCRQAFRSQNRDGLAIIDSQTMTLDGVVLENGNLPVPERMAQALSNRMCKGVLICLTAGDILQHGAPADRTSLVVLQETGPWNDTVVQLLRRFSDAVIDCRSHEPAPADLVRRIVATLGTEA